MQKFLLIAGLISAVCSAFSLANAPVLSDLKLAHDVPIVSSPSGEAWVVCLTLDIIHDDNGANPIAKVSNLTLRAYNYDEYHDPGVSPVPVATYIDHPFHPNEGNAVDDYPISIEIPKTASGHLVIEACAKHGNDWGCTTWEGWIPQEPEYHFSGNLQIPHGWAPRASGVFEGNVWVLHIKSCGVTVVSLDTDHCRLTRVGHQELRFEIPTEWRVWDDHEGEIVNTGWVPVAQFQAMFETNSIAIPPGWSGEIYFQARMIRNGLGDPAGDYSAALTVEIKLDGAEG